MTKDQIDEIAFKVARESNLRLDNACGCSTCRERDDPPRIKSFTHALLAELAKVQEPVDLRSVFKRILLETYAGKPSYYNEEQISSGCSNRASEYEEIAKRLGINLYTLQLPQPDLVAEIERLKAENLFHRITKEQDTPVFVKTVQENAVLRQQLSAAQASESELLNALETLACLGNVCRYGSGQWNAIAQKAITTHKTRK